MSLTAGTRDHHLARIGNAMYWLWKNPRERERVCGDPRLVANWIEETRCGFDGSTQMLARTATRDVELRGQRMCDAAMRVLLLIGAGNRDERVFAQPDVFDILRDASQHLAFGKGTHFCLGASLARLEARGAGSQCRHACPTSRSTRADWCACIHPTCAASPPCRSISGARPTRVVDRHAARLNRDGDLRDLCASGGRIDAALGARVKERRHARAAQRFFIANRLRLHLLEWGR